MVLLRYENFQGNRTIVTGRIQGQVLFRRAVRRKIFPSLTEKCLSLHTYGMNTFWEWLTEARRPHIEPAVLQGYEHAFKEELRKVIQRTQNPDLRDRLIEMLDCPIRTARGCRSFSDYIVGALIRNGIHHQYDLEAALGYVVEKMLMDKGESGEPRTTVFAGFEERPGHTPDFNPLQVRFMKYLQWAVNNVRKGKVPRLASVEGRPQGTVSIGQGRQKDGDSPYGISPDEIQARPSHEADLAELIGDIEGLLRRKEAAYGFPLVDLWRAMMNGMTVDQQRRQYGDRKVRPARQVVIQTIEDFARSTHNYLLLNLLRRLRDGQEEGPARKVPVRTPKPVLPEKERDYRSIASVVGRFERPVGTADLGKYRRRWLEYPPRNAGSGFRNRLEEVLAAMVKDGVLTATQGRQGATVYGRGPHFQQYAGVPV